MAVDVRHSPPPLHQPGDVTKRPKGILKNPSFSGPSGPGTGEPAQVSPTRQVSTPSFSAVTAPSPFTEEEAKEITLQNTLQNAGPRRSSSAARRASASRRASSHGLSEEDTDKMRLKWDEANLYLAEQDAGTRMKITEPKTPYQFGDQGAMEEDDEEDVAIDPRYVNVDEVDMMKSSRKGRESEIPGLELGEPEEDLGATSHLDEENERIVRENNRGSLSRESSGGKEKHVSVSEEGSGESGDQPGMPTREEQEKHRRFEERRKAHYEMKGMKGVLGNVDYMDEDDPTFGDMTLPERSANGAAR